MSPPHIKALLRGGGIRKSGALRAGRETLLRNCYSGYVLILKQKNLTIKLLFWVGFGAEKLDYKTGILGRFWGRET